MKTVGFRARSAYLGSILCCLIPVRKVSFINILYASNSYALGGKNQNDVFEERPRVMIGVSSAQTSIYKLDLYESTVYPQVFVTSNQHVELYRYNTSSPERR